jgi:hypothetical protein
MNTTRDMYLFRHNMKSEVGQLTLRLLLLLLFYIALPAVAMLGCGGSGASSCEECSLVQQSQPLPPEEGCWPYCEGEDTDGDGIEDSADSCVSSPETVNGYQDTDGCPDSAPISIAAVAFNGDFDDRAFGYTGSCTCVDHDGRSDTVQVLSCSPAQTTPVCSCRATGTGSVPDSTWSYDVICATPTDAPFGWSVTPSEVFRSPHGNGGTFFQYGAGRNPGTPRPPGYQVPDGTALYFQTCDDSDRWTNSIGPSGPPSFPYSPPDGLPDSDWCFQTPNIIVRSATFAPTPGATYRLSAWFYSTTFMAVGSTFENKLQVRVRFFDSTGNEVGSGIANAPMAAPISAWTEFSSTMTVPGSTSSAFVEVVEGRDHQSNVYVDDVTLIPL